MKLIRRLIHLLFSHKTKKQRQSNSKDPDHCATGKETQKPKPTPLADDDSPPGYKIRWYH